jgi:excisionase family DNA binding protein
MQDNLITVKEFAKRLGLAEITVRKWIQEEKIESFTVGTRSRRIPESEVERIKKGE